MPVEVSCSSCSGRFRVPDTAAGKKIKCPKCQSVIAVPAASGAPAAPSAPAAPAGQSPAQQAAGAPSSAPKVLPKAQPLATPKTKADLWHLKTEDGETYGPVSRPELDSWYAEGRITIDSQLLKDGSQQWQWASDLYPELTPPDDSAATQPPAAPGAPAFSAPPATGGSSASGGFNFGGETAAPASDAASGGFNFGAPASTSGGGSELSFGTPSASTGMIKAKAKGSSGSGQTSDKSRIVAALLCWFGGGFGIHRFYLGYTQIGILQILTCGGCGIWAIIDLVMILTRGLPDNNGRPLKD